MWRQSRCHLASSRLRQVAITDRSKSQSVTSYGMQRCTEASKKQSADCFYLRTKTETSF
jgi:hypothetical protein